jgi:chitin synthase
MELLFVHDLCGTFCFSMQFVIFMELVGTLALPAAISFTLYLIIMAILGQPAVLPLVLLALILGLPAVLIVMTSRKVVYVGWMIIYLFSLPIWNFVLPTYAYWHFDDFSWGDTRKVAGAEADKKGGHADKQGEFDSSQIVMKKWSEFEKERRINDAMERNMPVPKFADRNRRSIDVFRDSAFMKRYSKAGSTASTDSDIPLTQTGYDPAGLNKSIATYQNIRAYQNAGVRAMEESSGLESSTPPVESSTTDESVVSATPDIPLTLLHRTESSESSSSLGRSRGSYVASLAHSHIGNDDDDDDDDDEDSEDADAQTSFIQPNQQSNNNNNNLSIHNDWSNPAPHHNTHS